MSEAPRRYDWEDYLYPPSLLGLPDVLRNKAELRWPTDLHAFEQVVTAGRASQLQGDPGLVERTFDADHWKAIHGHLFQDVYEWAGEFRTVDIHKGGHSFVPERDVQHYADEILGQIRALDMFAGEDRDGVVDGLVNSMQALNIIHPFREGNGRTQRILGQHIAEYAGHLLDWSEIPGDEQNLMMAAAFDGHTDPLRQALDRAVRPIIRGGAVDASPWPTEPTVPARAPDFWRLTKPAAQVLAESRAQAAQSPADTAAPAPTAQLGPAGGYER